MDLDQINQVDRSDRIEISDRDQIGSIRSDQIWIIGWGDPCSGSMRARTAHIVVRGGIKQIEEHAAEAEKQSDRPHRVKEKMLASRRRR